jgi:hypothetical protein
MTSAYVYVELMSFAFVVVVLWVPGPCQAFVSSFSNLRKNETLTLPSFTIETRTIARHKGQRK